MDYLVYILFGKNKSSFKSELIYSLLSFKKMVAGNDCTHIGILVYTDETIELPSCLEDLSITFIYLNTAEVTDWIAQGNGHFLVLKARVMLNFLQAYEANGILVDTDTFFVDDPEKLFAVIRAGHLLMHLKEYPINQRPRIQSFFKNARFQQLNGDTYTISPDFYMWNSGIVGIHPGYIHLLPEIIYLIEQISFNKEWPPEEGRLIEQTVYSYFLQTQEAKLFPAEKWIVHYWFVKELRYLLGKYFNVSLQGEQSEFLEIIKNRNMGDWRFGNLAYDELLPLVFRFMRLYGGLMPYHYECLPANTFVGKVLRSV